MKLKAKAIIRIGDTSWNLETMEVHFRDDDPALLALIERVVDERLAARMPTTSPFTSDIGMEQKPYTGPLNPVPSPDAGEAVEREKRARIEVEWARSLNNDGLIKHSNDCYEKACNIYDSIFHILQAEITKLRAAKPTDIKPEEVENGTTE